MTGDTWDPKKLKGSANSSTSTTTLAARAWSAAGCMSIARRLAGDEPAMYFERLSRDGKRGIVIPKRPALDPVTIKPKGLNPRESYLVSFQESKGSETRTGADLMANGIKIDKMEPGELIYLNLPYHPGNRLTRCLPCHPATYGRPCRREHGVPRS